MWQAQKREGRKKTKGARERDYQLDHGRAGLFATYICKLVGSGKVCANKKNNSGLENFFPGSWLSFPQTSFFFFFFFFAKMNGLEYLKVI